LRLLYADRTTMVLPHINGEATFKVLSRSVEGDVLRYKLKMLEISRNHRSRAFCFSFDIGDVSVITEEFIVKTKVTKSKASTSRPVSQSDSKYKKQTREVLQHLQWSIGGYTSVCEGFVDFTRPIFSCIICKGLKEHGHATGCPIIALM
jgi:hypothetical protein